MIEFRNVTKYLGGKKILDDMSFSVREGETFCIVGPSGTGKSVTLNHMIGLYTADSGYVSVDGRDIAALSAKELSELRMKMGMLFQSGALMNWMTVYDNVALPLRERFRLPENAVRKKVMEILEFLELSADYMKYPGDVSGGMIKRAGLARAVVTNPKVMLYDEPTSGLDPVMSRKIDQLILALKKRFNMTSVVVTHDLCSAFGIADRIAMMAGGRIVACGTPDDFAASSNSLVKEFIAAQFANGM